MEIVWPRGSRSGSPYTPRRRTVSATSPPRGRPLPPPATRGTATTSLQARRPDPLFLGERDRLRVPRVRVAHDAEARVRRQHPLDPLLGGVWPVADDERARVRAVSDPHAATVVHGPEISARRRVEERVQDRPIRDRLSPGPPP